MKNETNSVVALLKAFDFQTLFRESLGWDNHRATMDIPIEGNTFHLAAVAEKPRLCGLRVPGHSRKRNPQEN